MAPAEGLVVALHAPWGSGKTSALNLLQRHLAVLDLAEHSKKPVDEILKMAAARPDAASAEERDLADEWSKLLDKHGKKLKTTVIRFNPWFFSGQENLFKAFFGVLGTELSIANNTKVAKAVAAVLKRSDAAGGMIGAAAGLALAGPAGAAGGATIGGFFGKLANDKFDTKESLEASLHKLREALQASDRRLLIVIDDIDRLLPEELRQILTLIKSLGNLPNVTYLLAFARAEVVDLIKRAGISNADYLDKIVQVSFELPRVDRYALRAMLFSRLDAVLAGRDLGDNSRWSQAFFHHIDPYLTTPRDVTRLCNSLQIIWPAVQGEVDWTDLVVLEVLRLHEPAVYDLVLEKLDRLTGEAHTVFDDKEWAKALVPTDAKSSNPAAAREALLYLFPNFAKALEKNTFGYSGRDRDALRNRRLQCPEYARNYFALAPASDQFTAPQIKNLFVTADPKDAFDLLFENAKKGKTRQGQTMVCRLLLQMKEEIPVAKLPIGLAKAVLARSDEILHVRDSERMLFETTNDLRLSWLFVEALRALPEDQRAAAAQQWFQGTVGGAFLARFIGSMTSKSSSSSETIFPDADYPTLRSLAADTVRALSKEPGFLRRPYATSLLFSWGHLTSFDEVSAWVKSHRKSDAGILELAAIMPSEVHSSASGLYYRVDRSSWNLLLDVDEFTKELRAIAATLQSDDPNMPIITKYEEALTKEQD